MNPRLAHHSCNSFIWACLHKTHMWLMWDVKLTSISILQGFAGFVYRKICNTFVTYTSTICKVSSILTGFVSFVSFMMIWRKNSYTCICYSWTFAVFIQSLWMSLQTQYESITNNVILCKLFRRSYYIYYSYWTIWIYTINTYIWLH